VTVGRPRGRRQGAAGQVLVIFGMSLGLLFGILGLVIDIGNIWNNSLHVQHAAEAGALAGVPYMPGDFTTAAAQARGVAARNGYATATGATVTPAADVGDSRRLDVTITKSFGTFFLRAIGLNQVTISRTATAEYTLPVPMGSPLSSLGDGSGNFWTVVAAQGSDRGNGDAFGSFYNPKPTLNDRYDANGYMYGIDVPAGAGSTTVDLYDATFCAVDANRGTGDRWLPWNQTGWPSMSTYYTLWSDPAGTPLDYTDDISVASSGTLFEDERQSDRSAAYRDTNASWPGSSFFSLTDCTNTLYHNRWWTLATLTSPGF